MPIAEILGYASVGVAAVALGLFGGRAARARFGSAAGAHPRLVLAAIALIAVSPFLGAAFYFNDDGQVASSPGLSAFPPSLPADAAPALDDVDTMTARLAARLRRQPEDAEGWRMLGWSYMHLERYAESMDAYDRAIALRPEAAAYRSAKGEAQVRADGGKVTALARVLFAAALERDRGDPQALFFMAMAKRQDGDRDGALKDWVALLGQVPPDEALAEALRGEIADVAGELGVDVASLVPPSAVTATAAPPPRPTAEDARRADNIAPEDRQDMIVAMVDRLEARLESNPRDHEGWIRLARSRLVLGDRQAARWALARAMEIFADAPATRAEIETAARELDLDAPSGR